MLPRCSRCSCLTKPLNKACWNRRKRVPRLQPAPAQPAVSQLPPASYPAARPAHPALPDPARPALPCRQQLSWSLQQCWSLCPVQQASLAHRLEPDGGIGDLPGVLCGQPLAHQLGERLPVAAVQLLQGASRAEQACSLYMPAQRATGQARGSERGGWQAGRAGGLVMARGCRPSVPCCPPREASCGWRWQR